MLAQSAVCVKVEHQGKDRANCYKLSLHGAVCASARGSTENRGLLTSQALLVSQASLCRKQAFVAFAQSAAVTIDCYLGYYTWKLLTFDTYTGQHKVSRLMLLAHWHASETCVYSRYGVKDLCTCPTLAMRCVRFPRR